MNFQTVGALIAKDLALFARNRFFGMVTILGLIAYVAIYFFMPKTVDEELNLLVYAPELPAALQQAQSEGLRVEPAASEDELRRRIEAGDFQAGLALPDGLAARPDGGRPQATLYFSPEVPAEFQQAIVLLVQELAYLQNGRAISLQAETEILGTDRVGAQIPPRDRLVPLMAVILLLTETMGMASLLSEEIEGHTLRALLVTPLTFGGLFLAKGIAGTGLAWSQAAILLGVTGGLSHEPLLLLAILLLGAALVTGLGFLLASVSRDLMSLMGWSIPLFIILSLPAFGILLPGVISGWSRLIPSYYLIEPVHQIVNGGVGPADVWPNLVVLLLLVVVFFALGIVALRRKLA